MRYLRFTLLLLMMTQSIGLVNGQGWPTLIAQVCKATKADLKSLDVVAQFVNKQSQDELSKAAIIYLILTQEVRYDIDALRQTGSLGNPDLAEPATVWARKLGVCSGYVAAYRYVADRVGLTTFEVNGFARSNEAEELRWEQPNHAWVCLRVGSNWHLIDPTWGAGSLQDGLNYVHKLDTNWFDVPPQRNILTHFPSAPMFQLLSCEVDLATIRKGSDAAILNEATQKKRCGSYQDSLEAYASITAEQQPLYLARQAYQYNPANTLDLGLAYVNLSAAMMSRLLISPKGEAALRQYAQEVGQVAEMAKQAKFYLSQSNSDAAKRISKVADNNLMVALKNQEQIRKLLRQYNK